MKLLRGLKYNLTIKSASKGIEFCRIDRVCRLAEYCRRRRPVLRRRRRLPSSAPPPAIQCAAACLNCSRRRLSEPRPASPGRPPPPPASSAPPPPPTSTAPPPQPACSAPRRHIAAAVSRRRNATAAPLLAWTPHRRRSQPPTQLHGRTPPPRTSAAGLDAMAGGDSSAYQVAEAASLRSRERIWGQLKLTQKNPTHSKNNVKAPTHS